MQRPHLIFAAIFTSAGALVAPHGVAHAEIGVFAAANQDLTGARPSEDARVLHLKDKVVANERIASAGDGGGQILFLDQTSLTISPNSDIVLDKYIYDADSGSGELGLTVLKGAMRLVGGRITKKNAAIIKTPTATIGIRGGMGSANVGDDGVTRYMHIAGVSSTIRTGSGELTITREGGYAEISANGDIDYQGVAPEGFVRSTYSSRSTGSGDGGGQADDSQTASGVDQVEEVVSGDDEATDQSAISTSGEQQNQGADDTDFETAENDADEEASDDILDDVGTDFDQQIDSLFTVGTFSATITADFDGNGTPGVQATDQTFVFAYSLTSDQGVVLIGLPETGDDLTVDAETRADIQAVGLDDVLARAGALGILEEPGVDGFLVSGFPLSGSAVNAPSGVDQAVVDTGFDNGGAPDPLIIDRDVNPGVGQNESFAGGSLTDVQLFVDETRRLSGNFEIEYDGQPDFDSLDRVQGSVDQQLTEEAGFGDLIDSTTDDIRTLLEEDQFGEDPNAPGGGSGPPPNDPNV